MVAEWGESRVLFMPQEAGTERLTSEMIGISSAWVTESAEPKQSVMNNNTNAKTVVSFDLLLETSSMLIIIA